MNFFNLPHIKCNYNILIKMSSRPEDEEAPEFKFYPLKTADPDIWKQILNDPNVDRYETELDHTRTNHIIHSNVGDQWICDYHNCYGKTDESPCFIHASDLSFEEMAAKIVKISNIDYVEHPTIYEWKLEDKPGTYCHQGHYFGGPALIQHQYGKNDKSDGYSWECHFCGIPGFDYSVGTFTCEYHKDNKWVYGR